jgi:GTP cyclohydrolase I
MGRKEMLEEKLKVSASKTVTVTIIILQQINKRKFCEEHMIPTFLQWLLSETIK